MTKTTGYLGELEQMVLLAILQLDDQAYGTNVMDELKKRVERSVSRGALYVTFDRLEDKGLLSSRVGDPNPRRGGRPKRFLTVTPTGVEALQKSRSAWMRLWDGLDSVLEQQCPHPACHLRPVVRPRFSEHVYQRALQSRPCSATCTRRFWIEQRQGNRRPSICAKPGAGIGPKQLRSVPGTCFAKPSYRSGKEWYRSHRFNQRCNLLEVL